MGHDAICLHVQALSEVSSSHVALWNLLLYRTYIIEPSLPKATQHLPKRTGRISPLQDPLSEVRVFLQSGF